MERTRSHNTRVCKIFSFSYDYIKELEKENISYKKNSKDSIIFCLFSLTNLISISSFALQSHTYEIVEEIRELLDKLQKWICRIVGNSLAASLEPLAHHRNVASLSLFCRYYFGWCSSELAQLVPLPFSRGRSTHYCDRLHDCFVTIPRCYKGVYVNSFFPRTARL